MTLDPTQPAYPQSVFDDLVAALREINELLGHIPPEEPSR